MLNHSGCLIIELTRRILTELAVRFYLPLPRTWPKDSKLSMLSKGLKNILVRQSLQEPTIRSVTATVRFITFIIFGLIKSE